MYLIKFFLKGPDAVQPFITVAPEYTVRQGVKNDFDTLIGFNSQESFALIGSEYKNPALLEPFNEKFQIQLPLRGRKKDYESEVVLKLIFS